MENIKIDFTTLPYDHKGRWQKKYPSIMNPLEKVTWPQLIAEFVIYWRIQFVSDYKHIKMGPKWYFDVAQRVKELNQQSIVICNYFPHPDDEPLIIPAVKNFFRRIKPLKLGKYKKHRIIKRGNRDIINITEEEKNIIRGISAELHRLVKQRDSFINTKPIKEVTTEITFKNDSDQFKEVKSGIVSLLELEKKLNPLPS